MHSFVFSSNAALLQPLWCSHIFNMLRSSQMQRLALNENTRCVES